MLIALDLSTKRSGVAVYGEDGKLLKYFAITPNQKDDPYYKNNCIVKGLKTFFALADDVIIEGIFLNTFTTAGRSTRNVVGFETLARLNGAVVQAWLEIHPEKLPMIIKATEARKLVGVKGTCQKAEVQVWVCEKYGFADQEMIDAFKGMIENETGAYQQEEFTKATWKKHMDKISLYIEDQTGISEDIADAILLGEAWFKYKGGLC